MISDICTITLLLCKCLVLSCIISYVIEVTCSFQFTFQWQLDLRCGAKKSLADPPKQCLSLKSCDISTTLPHLLLVGGSDTFARLYDRRMLPPLSSCQKKTKPPPCVKYFCPMHLSDRRTPSLHLTHVTFSPIGEEVLLSYSGEHVYLMDVNLGGDSVMKFTAEDVSKQLNLAPIISRTKKERILTTKEKWNWISKL